MRCEIYVRNKVFAIMRKGENENVDYVVFIAPYARHLRTAAGCDATVVSASQWTKGAFPRSVSGERHPCAHREPYDSAANLHVVQDA
jgi:hypothetical protein